MINNGEVHRLQRDFAIDRPLCFIYEMQVFYVHEHLFRGSQILIKETAVHIS